MVHYQSSRQCSESGTHATAALLQAKPYSWVVSAPSSRPPLCRAPTREARLGKRSIGVKPGLVVKASQVGC
jgi:hypothetical protein